MKIKILIATADGDYVEHLSRILSEKYADTFEITVCSTLERFEAVLAANTFDVALAEPTFLCASGVSAIRMPLLLHDELNSAPAPDSALPAIRKHQKISSIVGAVLEHYAELEVQNSGVGINRAHITAVWSPSGGVGKTTVALAYAAHMASNNKQVLYLNLENFSSTSAYFKESGKSISKIFEKLEANTHILLKGIRQQDTGSGISYFCGPGNYDDINILSPSDIEVLIGACASQTDELILDLSSQCDARTQKMFAIADAVFLVRDSSDTSGVKLSQFMRQHNIFEQIRGKATLIDNRGAKSTDVPVGKTIRLPFIQSSDPVSIFKTLSSGSFNW